MARKSQITVTSRADAAKTRAVAQLRDNPVLARRLAGNIQGGGSIGIPLREPERWYTRIENQLADPNMFYRMRHEMGYVPLTADDLPEGVTPTAIGFRVSEDGYLVRGPVGQEEMPWKMPKEDRALLEQAMTDQNMAGIGSTKKIKNDMAEAAGSQFGSEAGDFMNSLSGEVIDSIGQ
jgi:hypothetical protein